MIILFDTRSGTLILSSKSVIRQKLGNLNDGVKKIYFTMSENNRKKLRLFFLLFYFKTISIFKNQNKSKNGTKIPKGVKLKALKYMSITSRKQDLKSLMPFSKYNPP